MSDTDVTGARFEASPLSVREARHFVCRALDAWGLERLGDAAALCASELVANAVLHGRSPFDVVVRRLADGGARIDVIDERPAEVPIPVPVDGTAADITRRAATGRGLQLVAATARSWGYTTSERDKAVWVELDGVMPATPTDPVIAGSGPRVVGGIRLRLLRMPVRAAVASGMQVDELLRWLHLGDATTALVDPPRLRQLLDDSAPPRLAGRLAALRAAGRHERQFDLDVEVPRSSLVALGHLNERLRDLAAPGTEAAVTPEVAALRRWLGEETARQLRGEAPAPCRLPA